MKKKYTFLMVEMQKERYTIFKTKRKHQIF